MQVNVQRAVEIIVWNVTMGDRTLDQGRSGFPSRWYHSPFTRTVLSSAVKKSPRAFVSCKKVAFPSEIAVHRLV